MTEFYYLKPRR